MSPNEPEGRERIGEVTFTKLTKSNRVDWFDQAQTYLNGKQLFWVIDPKMCLTKKQKNSYKLANPGYGESLPSDGTTPDSEMDETYAAAFAACSAFLRMWVDGEHLGKLNSLSDDDKTPAKYWETLKGVDGLCDLGSSAAGVNKLFGKIDVEERMVDVISTLRKGLLQIAEVYKQRKGNNIEIDRNI
jgi:hypothetical protein